MKRRPGTGTVQFHNGCWRLRLPRSLDPSRQWLHTTFPAAQEAVAHAYMDECVVAARKRRSVQMDRDGLTFAAAWPRYVSQVSRAASRRHGEKSGAKVRSRLEGMGENWLATSPFWGRCITDIRGTEIQDWLEGVQLEGRSAKGLPISDSWVSQCGGAIRGAFALLKLPCPSFHVEVEHQRVKSALNLRQQERFFQEVLDDPLDRLMAGCQLGAGLRVWELLSLEVDRIDLGDDPHLLITTGGPDGAPTKSRKPRRVELFEPGLGFFRRALQYAHRPNDRGLLFAGPRGGYLSAWPEQFVAWSEILGERLTSHGLRHAYAYSMLSGLWGYPPQGITFISLQLGHSDIRTTQRAYGHWDPGAGLATARVLRGETPGVVEPVTAARLLGEGPDSCSPARSPLRSRNPEFSTVRVDDGSSPNSADRSALSCEVGYPVVHETARALANAVRSGQPAIDEAAAFLRLFPDDRHALTCLFDLLDGDPTAVTRALQLAIEVLSVRTESERREGGAA